jgi:hypothetical protein
LKSINQEIISYYREDFGPRPSLGKIQESQSVKHLQLEIDCIEWPLKKREVNKIPNDRLEGVIRSVKDFEKRKDKAMKRSDTDDLWIKIKSLQWVLFVIFAIKNGNMVVI